MLSILSLAVDLIVCYIYFVAIVSTNFASRNIDGNYRFVSRGIKVQNSLRNIFTNVQILSPKLHISNFKTVSLMIYPNYIILLWHVSQFMPIRAILLTPIYQNLCCLLMLLHHHNFMGFGQFRFNQSERVLLAVSQ